MPDHPISQNGWAVVSSGSSPLLVAIPKIVGRVRAGDVATVLAYLVERFDAEVEDVDAGRDDWGYAYRPIAGQSSGYSNHASGTALDLNATRHVLGQRGTFTRAQHAALRRILADLGGVVRWGGDYSGRADEMHFEIVGSAAQVAAVAARIRGGQLVTNPGPGGGQVPGEPDPTAPTPIKEDEDDMSTYYEATSDADFIFAGWVYEQGPDGILRALGPNESDAHAQAHPQTFARRAMWSGPDLRNLALACGMWEFTGTKDTTPIALTGAIIGRDGRTDVPNAAASGGRNYPRVTGA